MLMGPPKALEAAKPTSSSKTITTLGAFAGAFTSKRGGAFASLASSPRADYQSHGSSSGLKQRLAVTPENYGGVHAKNYWTLVVCVVPKVGVSRSSALEPAPRRVRHFNATAGGIPAGLIRSSVMR